MFIKNLPPHRALAAVVAALGLSMPLPARAVSNWTSCEARMESDAWNQLFIIQFARNAQIVGGTASDIVYGNRSISGDVSTPNRVAYFIYDYSEGRYTAGFWRISTHADWPTQ